MGCYHDLQYMFYLKVGTPLSALIPAPESTTMFLAFARTSRNAFMSLDGPLDSEAITVYVIKTSASTWKWSSTTLKPERVVNETSIVCTRVDEDALQRM